MNSLVSTRKHTRCDIFKTARTAAIKTNQTQFHNALIFTSSSTEEFGPELGAAHHMPAELKSHSP
jgi:hypothetical protein